MIIQSEKLDNEVTDNFFYQAVSVYLRKTQVVNRKLSCSANVKFWKLKYHGKSETLLEKLNDKIGKQRKDAAAVEDTLVEEGIEFNESSIDCLTELTRDDNGVYLSIDTFTPRNKVKFADHGLQLTIIGKIIDAHKTKVIINIIFQTQEKHVRPFAL
jgi:hypothetical protein